MVNILNKFSIGQIITIIRIIFVVVILIINFDTMYLVDASQDPSINDNITIPEEPLDKGKAIDTNPVDTTSSESNTQTTTQNKGKSKEDRELMMQNKLNAYMDSLLADTRSNIASSSDTADLEKAYYDQIDTKLEVEKLTMQMQDNLSINNSTEGSSSSDPNSSLETSGSSNPETQVKKRIAEDNTSESNKKTKN
jgi:hypothetical protein